MPAARRRSARRARAATTPSACCESMGVRLGLSTDGAGHTVTLNGPATLRGFEVRVPADFSSAAFFIVAGCLGARDGLLIENVGINPTRTGLLAILREMGATIELRNAAQRRRRAGRRSLGHAKRAQGDRGAARARAARHRRVPDPVHRRSGCDGRNDRQRRGRAAQERDRSNRRHGAGARRPLGIEVEERPDGARIVGGRLRGGTVDSRGDHRIAMSFAVASLLRERADRDPRTRPRSRRPFRTFSTSRRPSVCRSSASGDGA